MFTAVLKLIVEKHCRSLVKTKAKMLKNGFPVTHKMLSVSSEERKGVICRPNTVFSSCCYLVRLSLPQMD